MLVWRFADYDQPEGMISFHVALFKETDPQATAGESASPAGEWQVEVHTTLQPPFLEADLVAAVEAAGFREVRSYGRTAWPAEPFDRDSPPDLVIVARRA